jgi:hypothetical protein
MADSKKNEAAGPDVKKVVEELPEANTDASGKTLYVLTAKYWDGSVIHERGSKLYFADGEGPKKKIPASEAQDVAPNDVPLTTASNEVKGK